MTTYVLVQEFKVQLSRIIPEFRNRVFTYVGVEEIQVQSNNTEQLQSGKETNYKTTSQV